MRSQQQTCQVADFSLVVPIAGCVGGDGRRSVTLWSMSALEVFSYLRAWEPAEPDDLERRKPK